MAKYDDKIEMQSMIFTLYQIHGHLFLKNQHSATNSVQSSKSATDKQHVIIG